MNINVENRHVDSFNSFYKLFKNVDESFDNHVDITFNDFLMKEFIILSYHCKESSGLLTHNNFVKKE